MRLMVVLLCALAPMSAMVSAQDLPRASAAVTGGLTIPVGDAREAMGSGWNVGVAGTLQLRGRLGVRADYLYSRFAAATTTWDVTLGPMLPAFMEVAVSAKSQMHAGSVDLAWTRPLPGNRRAYLVAGPTLFHRRAQITGTARGEIAACEPLWLQCTSEPVGFDRAIGIKTSNDVGFNVGAGFAFRAGLTALLTIEARYFYVAGRRLQGPGGRDVRSSAHFVPISVGLTF